MSDDGSSITERLRDAAEMDDYSLDRLHRQLMIARR
jgi:hypothetical protein